MKYLIAFLVVVAVSVVAYFTVIADKPAAVNSMPSTYSLPEKVVIEKPSTPSNVSAPGTEKNSAVESEMKKQDEISGRGQKPLVWNGFK